MIVLRGSKNDGLEIKPRERGSHGHGAVLIHRGFDPFLLGGTICEER